MSQILTFKVSLPESNFPIWRRFQVRDDYRLDRFHQVIQIVMGWHNSHLHEFEIKGERYGMALGYDDGFDEGIDETTVFLKDFSFKAGDRIGYLYDFGDSWEHILELENMEAGNQSVPVCLKGKNACPPEDSGGIWGYMDLVETLKDPKHPDYDDLINWVPRGFDPNRFDIDAVNRELKKFGEWHNKHPRKKSTPWHQLE